MERNTKREKWIKEHTPHNLVASCSAHIHKSCVLDAVIDTLMGYIGPKLKAMEFPIYVSAKEIKDTVLKEANGSLTLDDLKGVSIREECTELIRDLNMLKMSCSVGYAFMYYGSEDVVITGTVENY